MTLTVPIKHYPTINWNLILRYATITAFQFQLNTIQRLTETWNGEENDNSMLLFQLNTIQRLTETLIIKRITLSYHLFQLNTIQRLTETD